MNTIQFNFQELADEKTPRNLHRHIMERVVWSRILPTFLVAVVFVCVGVIVSAWHAMVASADADLFSLIRLAGSDFELSWSYISDFAVIIYSAIPIIEVSLFLLMVGLAIQLYRLYRSLARFSSSSPPSRR